MIMQDEVLVGLNSKKKTKWVKRLISKKKKSDDTVQLCEEKIATKQEGAKKLAHQVLKQVKKTTWSGLKFMYKGFLYSSHYYPYTSTSMPGVDPFVYTSPRYPPAYRYTYHYYH